MCLRRSRISERTQDMKPKDIISLRATIRNRQRKNVLKQNPDIVQEARKDFEAELAALKAENEALKAENAKLKSGRRSRGGRRKKANGD